MRNIMPLHPLHVSAALPREFTYPFCYEPHPLCVAAAGEVQRYISDSGVWSGENSVGKMFGVLVVEASDASVGYLAAYSGLLAGRNDWPFFVPPVFDAQQPDGHFKQEERRISAVNGEISDLENSYRYALLKASYMKQKQLADGELAVARQKMVDAKVRRDNRRREAEQGGAEITDVEKAEMTRESQFLKASLRRVRQRHEAELARLRQPVEEYESRIASLRRQRRRMSDELQLWLFSQYRMLNALGEERDLVGIFSDSIGAMPPAGSGDCCAPKLLQYAYRHGLRPVCMAEFWWGGSPRQEIRHHLHYYPACRSKCLPILSHMLRGLNVEPNPLERGSVHGVPRIVYEDDAVVVVDKPAGMLSVPGKTGAVDCGDVEAFVHRHLQRKHDSAQFKNQESEIKISVKAVHRLDMDTSGLLVLALTDEAYVALQRQFALREVSKRYEAVVEGMPSPDAATISLPLIADIMDRPRQKVDYVVGKPAVTDYRVVRRLADGNTLVYLYPHTGRTHQLRVHCAHVDGMRCPIVGDPLYGHGTRSGRMCLHAAMVEFCHPLTGERMRFESPSGFGESKG